MKLAIMQPYFLPYIGYFQLLSAVDTFVLYDNVKHTKKGWINRNRMLREGKDVMFSLPLKAASDSEPIGQRELATAFDANQLLRQLSGAYQKAPFFYSTLPLLEAIVTCPERNLFRYIYNSIVLIRQHLGLTAKLLVSSDIQIDHGLKGQDKVLALCRHLGATTYINAIGGVDLYSNSAFLSQGIALTFLRSIPVEYPQFEAPFVPWLSIVDVLMFNSKDETRDLVTRHFEFVRAGLE